MKKIVALLKGNPLRIALGAALFVPALVLEHTGYTYVSLAFYILALVTVGSGVFIDAVRGILRRDLLDEKFLMSVASIGAMIVGEWSEGVAVMLFFLIGETFEHIAVRRSRSSIRALMDICPDEASVLTDEGEITLDADEVEPGSVIVIRPGERVPIDCVIISGSTDVDTSSMTGESIPRSASVGDELDSGVVVIDGMITAKTLRPAEESAAARVLELVENASENKSREESFITAFSRVYTPIVVSLALLLSLIPPLFSLMSFGESVYRALIFLVISCPCALVISVPMAFFGGIGGAASRGILFKGGSVFSKLAKADTAALDKTGTVTTGRFAVSDVEPSGISREELIRLAASCEYASNHPIAASVRAACGNAALPSRADEIAGEGVIAEVEGFTVAVGNSLLMRRVGASVEEEKAGRIYVARNGEYIGCITVSDEIRPEASSAINALRSVGVRKSHIVSGDRLEAVSRTAKAISADHYYGELAPDEKYRRLKQIISTSRGGVIYVGDGINDAPALALADVSVAMGGIGQDSAIEAADAVIMTDDLMRLPEAVLIARKTIGIAKENIVFALGVKGAILVLGALGFANMWLAVFADVGVAVLAILNAMRALHTPKLKKSGGK